MKNFVTFSICILVCVSIAMAAPDNVQITSPSMPLTQGCFDNDAGSPDPTRVASYAYSSDGKVLSDRCQYDPYLDKHVLSEATCLNGTFLAMVEHVCVEGCHRGKCGYLEQQHYCIDSDQTISLKEATPDQKISIFSTRGAVMGFYPSSDDNKVFGTWVDYCASNNMLVEYYCKNNEARFATVSCKGGCIDGRCTKPFCIDSDGGNVKNNVGTANGIYYNNTQYQLTDYCVSNITLREYQCDVSPNDGVGSVQVICPTACENGKCVLGVTQPPAANNSCNNDLACGYGKVCVSSQCKQCRNNLQCLVGKYCSNNVCVNESNANGFVQLDSLLQSRLDSLTQLADALNIKEKAPTLTVKQIQPLGGIVAPTGPLAKGCVIKVGAKETALNINTDYCSSVLLTKMYSGRTDLYGVLSSLGYNIPDINNLQKSLDVFYRNNDGTLNLQFGSDVDNLVKSNKCKTIKYFGIATYCFNEVTNNKTSSLDKMIPYMAVIKYTSNINFSVNKKNIGKSDYSNAFAEILISKIVYYDGNKPELYGKTPDNINCGDGKSGAHYKKAAENGLGKDIVFICPKMLDQNQIKNSKIKNVGILFHESMHLYDSGHQWYHQEDLATADQLANTPITSTCKQATNIPGTRDKGMFSTYYNHIIFLNTLSVNGLLPCQHRKNAYSNAVLEYKTKLCYPQPTINLVEPVCA